jgi:hypothetical protein
MQPVASTRPSSASSPRGFRDDATCTIYATPPLVLRLDWEIVARLASRWSKPLDLDACLAPFSSPRRFCGAIAKPRNCHRNFVGQIAKPQLLVLSPNPRNPREWFWGQTTRIVATSFEVKPRETVNLSFEAQRRNSRSSSPFEPCRPRTASPGISIVWPSSTQPVLDHPRSSAPSLLLLPQSLSLPSMPHMSPIHNETSKPRQVNYSSQMKPKY